MRQLIHGTLKLTSTLCNELPSRSRYCSFMTAWIAKASAPVPHFCASLLRLAIRHRMNGRGQRVHVLGVDPRHGDAAIPRHVDAVLGGQAIHHLGAHAGVTEQGRGAMSGFMPLSVPKT